jgi:SAM-dependent methyltransferase
MNKKYWNKSSEGYNKYGLPWHWLVVAYLPVLNTLKNSLGRLDKAKILDFGCGGGRISKLYKDFYCADVVGADISEEMINEARKNDPTGKYILVDEHYKIPLNVQLDCSMANWVLVSICSLELMTMALKEVYGLLKKDGIFVALVNNEDFVGKRSQTWRNGEAGKVYNSGDEIISTFFKDGSEDIAVHNYFWTKEDYCTALRNAGFNQVRSFVPNYNNEEIIQEIKYLQDKGFFPEVDYKIDKKEAPTRLIVGIK